MGSSFHARRKPSLFALSLMIALAAALCAPAAYANPFEPLPSGHWAYDAVTRLSQTGLLKEHIGERVRLGYHFTYLDLSLWVGDALDCLHRLVGDEATGRTATFQELIGAYNASTPLAPLSAVEITLFADLIGLVREHLQILGYAAPAGIGSGGAKILPGGLAGALNGLRPPQLPPSIPEADLNDVLEKPSDTEASEVTASILPQLEVAGAVDRAPTASTGTPVFRVGATAQPFPDLTLGALVFGAERPSRLFGHQGFEQLSRIDLSAEFGQWILSLRRRQIVRIDSDDNEEMSILTRVGVEYPLGERALIRAGRETEQESGASSGEKNHPTTEFDLEVRYDQGKIGLGFVLESVSESIKGSGIGAIKTKASLEHALGPVATATAGISIGGRDEGMEPSSNVGLRYDFDDATLTLQYLLFAGDERRVTTAEVSIKF